MPDRIVISELVKSALCYAVGIGCFWLSIGSVKRWGDVAPELLLATWFAATVVGVSAFSGKFIEWPRTEQVVAVLVMCGIGWLMFRTGG